VSSAAPALLAAAAGVGIGHAILPDHWVPLAVVGRARRYPPSRVARLSGLAGVAHVLVSIVLGAVVVTVGLQLRSQVKGAEDTIVGVILLATALGFAIVELTGHGHHHDHSHDHDHDHDHDHSHDHDHDHDHTHDHDDDDTHDDTHAHGRLSGLAAVMVPFGAAASPDLTILPVFLAAAAAGVATAIASVIVFAVATVATIMALTLAAYLGVLQIRGEWLERWGNLVTALVLAVIGALVLFGVL
jgi:nickel/cobalt transporter (NicO) family protein